MPNRVALFIDGAYLDFVLRDEFQNTHIDYGALSTQLAGDGDILRTYYYHCPVFQGNPPLPEESARYAAQRKFFAALENLPRYTVRLGRLEFRGNDQTGRPRYEQKRVDILLGVALVQLSTKKTIQEAILVAGDSDFIPAVIAANQEGVLVRLYHGARPHNDLWQECDERHPISHQLIDAVHRERPA